MKLTLTRASALLALALGLTACGGKAKFELGGPIVGLAYGGLVITNATNGDSVTVEKTATSYKLSKTLEYGQPYDVSITKFPEHQNCTLFGGKDTAGRLASISIGVQCTVLTFPIGGTVTGLTEKTDNTPTGLRITNGADTVAIEKNTTASTKYVMPTPVAYGQAYGVAIVSQPTGQTCSIANASGTLATELVTPAVGDTPAVYSGVVENINITCVTP